MDFTKLSQFMDRLTDWIIPGNVVSVYHKGEEVFRYASGYSDLENKIPMTDDKLFNIYSCSKLTTVTAALQLYEKGFFLLDDPISEYIPEFAEMYVKNADGSIRKAENPITFRNLFTHTAGFSYDMESPELKKLRKETDGRMPTVEVARAIAREPLLFEPGTAWRYSRAHDVLGAFVEVISGKRFSEYVKQNIFTPLDVHDIYYHRDESLFLKMAEQYDYVYDKSENDIVKLQMQNGCRPGKLVNAGKNVVCHDLGTEYDSGGAGITISVPEYAKFANALAMGGLAHTGERILSKGTVDLLRANQLSDKLRFDFLRGTAKNHTGYSYGLGVRTLHSRAEAGFNGVSGEFGWGGAAGGTILCDPDNQFSYFYSHHMLNPQEHYYQPRLRNVAYSCFFSD